MAVFCTVSNEIARTMKIRRAVHQEAVPGGCSCRLVRVCCHDVHLLAHAEVRIDQWLEARVIERPLLELLGLVIRSQIPICLQVLLAL